MVWNGVVAEIIYYNYIMYIYTDKLNIYIYIYIQYIICSKELKYYIHMDKSHCSNFLVCDPVMGDHGKFVSFFNV